MLTPYTLTQCAAIIRAKAHVRSYPLSFGLAPLSTG